MGRIDDASPGRNLIQLVDKDRALLSEVAHNVRVMNDFLPHVDRCAKGIKGDADNVDRSHNTSANTTGL